MKQLNIAVASGKGGTGKTTLSVNLAAFLAESEATTLVDLDVEEPNASLFFAGEPNSVEKAQRAVPVWQRAGCTLCGLCQEVCHFNAVLKMGDRIMVFPELCHGCYACSELCPAETLPMHPREIGEISFRTADGLEIIEGRLSIGEEQAVPLIQRTIEAVEQRASKAGIRILDSPPGTSCPVIEVIRRADFIILITEPTPFGLHDFSLAVETVRKLEVEFGAVINRVGLGDNKLEEYCRREKIPVLARIADSRRVAELYTRGELLYPAIEEYRSSLEDIVAAIEARFPRDARGSTAI